MIKSLKDLRCDVMHEVQKGKGSIQFQHLLDKQDFHDKGRLYAIITIKPGDSIGLHYHRGEQESYFVLEGNALYNDNGTGHMIGPGDFTFCPDGSCHAVQNVGDSDSRFIALITYTGS